MVAGGACDCVYMFVKGLVCEVWFYSDQCHFTANISKNIPKLSQFPELRGKDTNQIIAGLV